MASVYQQSAPHLGLTHRHRVDGLEHGLQIKVLLTKLNAAILADQNDLIGIRAQQFPEVRYKEPGGYTAVITTDSILIDDEPENLTLIKLTCLSLKLGYVRRRVVFSLHQDDAMLPSGAISDESASEAA